MASRNYPLRVQEYSEILESDGLDALSSIPSSPLLQYPLPSFDDVPPVPFRDLDLDDDDTDDDFVPMEEHHTHADEDKKALAILRYMKAQFPHFSLKHLLTATFHEDASKDLEAFSNSFQKADGTVQLMERFYEIRGIKDEAMCYWIVGKAGGICAKEASELTRRAARGGLSEDASFFRVNSKKIPVDMVEDFRISDLTKRYDRVMPYLQSFFKAVIRKEGTILGEGVRDPNMVSLT